ncbi:hypothetical protein [Streptomyces cupreus]|uniref:XRE family transcriptional regulator n=1 Tax=Streptomyces cupreus TaxID=2759956 RepID=A0A7X1J570_9ACTN|nr:hypothetical protein [Streptomyces cupreus]MBC2904365.1 hypothetical protein [Streptomyces cupreus]
MNESADETAENDSPAQDGLAALLAELRDLERALPPTAQEHLARLLSPEKLSYDTGIEAERVAELLAGAEPDTGDSKDAAQDRYLARLVFLRATRLKRPMTRRLSGRTPRPYTYGEIARGAGLSRQTVHYVFTEGRQTSPENVAGMERFFGALPGFCFYTESEALASQLGPIVKHLRVLKTVADAYEHGVTKIAARSGEDLSGDADAMDEILAAVIAARRRQ